MRQTFFLCLVGLGIFCNGRSFADQAGRRYAENDLHALPAIEISVGLENADIIGSDNRALQAAVDYVGNLGGGTVNVGPGEFLMRDSLHLRSRVTVRGTTGQTILKKDIEYRTPYWLMETSARRPLPGGSHRLFDRGWRLCCL